MEEYKDKFVPPLTTCMTIADVREHSEEQCKVLYLCNCNDLICDECVYDTLAMTVDYLFYKGYIDKAGAMELTLSGIEKD